MTDDDSETYFSSHGSSSPHTSSSSPHIDHDHDHDDDLDDDHDQDQHVQSMPNVKQKRLIKNREAAQLFRQRQKEYIGTLELKASTLQTSNDSAESRIELLTRENGLMRQQVDYLRTFVKQAVSSSRMPLASIYNSNGNIVVPLVMNRSSSSVRSLIAQVVPHVEPD
ncbi:hypothetical protein SAMD00019534_015310 [Acytostelium subglobosum LB1]|uniref:hypothetical protein n=1 Tax=Acytostelium subglobosum LB1 TaxID=1410327 RepID=UPI000644809A|nr:hypothetical protein SAMD00019534_015310 [Acytostelium subglobosum LB1]GAM18356.1 hypothetical protein SAMD00019534_015310 [Acytostelium subglobosum LB1]|eukprot:XP_012757576.1 hypothetical protein SAMD00019534_015310 [Acytostelium subglobosum LB1]